MTDLLSEPRNDRILFLRALREVAPYLKRYTDDAIQKRAGKDKLEDAIAVSMELIETGTRSANLTDTEVFALLTQTLNCLVKYVRDTMQVPPTLNVLMDSIHLLDFAVNKAFPGYVKAGFLKHVILPRTVAPVL